MRGTDLAGSSLTELTLDTHTDLVTSCEAFLDRLREE